MASFTSNGDFAPGQAFRFGSLDFIADDLGNLHLTVPMNRSPITRFGESESESDSSPVSADLSFVGFVDSLFPAINEAPGSDQESDQAESMESFAPPLEVFMAEGGDTNQAMETPIAEQTPEQLENTRRRLQDEQTALARQQEELEQQRRDRVQALRGRGRQVNLELSMRKKDDVEVYPTAGGNLIAAHMLAKKLQLAEGTPEHETIRQVKVLLEEAAIQQATPTNVREQSGESPEPERTRDRSRGQSGDSPPRPVGQQPAGAVHERLGPDRDVRHTLDARRRENVHQRLGPDRDVRNTLNARRRNVVDVSDSDNDDDRNPRHRRRTSRSPPRDQPYAGIKAFGPRVLNAAFPERFRVNGVERYTGETQPDIWLSDYRIACRTSGGSDLAAVHCLPLHLADSARAWLDSLPPGCINSWADLEVYFVDNFQGTYNRPGNAWDLHSCIQGDDETLRDYIRRFSKKKNSLPNIREGDVITAFSNGVRSADLIHKIARKNPQTTRQLFDIANGFATGEEAVRSKGGKGKSQDAPESSKAQGGTQSTQKNRKRKGGNFVAATETAPQQKQQARQSKQRQSADGKKPAPHGGMSFEEVLDLPCHLHGDESGHSTRECYKLRNLMKKATEAGQKDSATAAAAAFPKEDEVLMIFGGSNGYESKRRQKVIAREVNMTAPAVPQYLKWSEHPISFDRTDHPDYIPEPGKFPLVVDPLFRTTRLRKVLMDGGSGLNILYVKTLDDMKIDRSEIKKSGAPFHGVVPGRPARPLGRIALEVTFGTPDNFRTETLTFEVVDFPGSYHALLGRPCFAKFMAVPNYTYLKLKMPGPNGVITVHGSFQHSYLCDVESCELAANQDVATELEDLKVTMVESEPPAKKSASSANQSAQGAKTVQLTPTERSSKESKPGGSLANE